MNVQAWLNGEALSESGTGLAFTNRGLHYGDGVFETMLWQRGGIRLLDAHLDRANEGCRRLGIVPPPRTQLVDELTQLPVATDRAIAKLLLIRAGTGRGYKPQPNSGAIRLTLLYPWTDAALTLRVQWCATRWSSNPQLAGLKHLNRLEQVLAQQELETGCDEGLMLDADGELVSATSGNIFVVSNGTLRTPKLLSCGVHGVMRQHVIGMSATLGIAVEERSLLPADLDNADEAFVTNAVRGIRPIIALGARRWPSGVITQRLQRALAS